MWVWFSVDGQSRPSVLHDGDVCGMNVLVGLDEVGAEDGSELFGGIDWILLCNDVGGLFHCVGRYYYRVVGVGVSGLWLAASL